LASAISNGQVGVPYDKGATGDVINVIANGLYTLDQNALWDTGTLLAEFSYTHLQRVTGNKDTYNGDGYASCVDAITGGPGGKKDGCATRNALGVAVTFEPQWLQAFPGVDLSMPASFTYGISGNPAYAGGAFYAEGTKIYSLGIKAIYKQVHSVTLQYNGYHWNTRGKTDMGAGLAYAGGNGPIGLNDKGWVEMQFKTSF
jgi:hypothetical protein